MPFCKICGTFYPKSLGVCPKCNEKQILEEQPEAVRPASLSEAEASRQRQRSWIGICIGVPALIGLLYGIYYVMQLLSR